MLITESDIATVQSLNERGLYLQAYEASKTIAPLKMWRGPNARLLAGRLASNLGASRLGNALFWLNHREYPDHERTKYYYTSVHLRHFGPYSALKLMAKFGERCGEDEQEQAEWLSLRAYLFAVLRDFDSADRDIEQAMAMTPQHKWLSVQHAGILEMEDRYDEALGVAQDLLGRHPWYRAGVQSLSHQLEISGKPDEAITLLRAACEHLECGDLHIHLARLLRNRHELIPARDEYETAIKHYPLLDESVGDTWLNRVRSDIACQLGDYEQGLALLQQIKERDKHHFHKEVQKRLETPGNTGTRKQLNLPFVRQHHMTCAPATLTMIARFWGNDAEHLEIAEDICYDGTPYHAERRWAEEQGYIVREFTLTPDIAHALIDRGVPFTFSTVEPTSAHLQAVIGYDSARGVLLLRDPFYPSISEILADSLGDRYGPYGPRGMLLLPPEQADLIQGLDLPDENAWNLTHALRCALVDHQRADAIVALKQLEQDEPDSTRTLSAQLSLADYDGDTEQRARLVDALLERYPKCPAMAFRQFNCLREQGRLEEAKALLDQWRNNKTYRHPVFLEEYARMLSRDAREETRARFLLKQAVQRSSRTAENYYNLAGFIWDKGSRDEATQLYRFAACLEDRREVYALAYFRAQRFLGREAETLELLHRRLKRDGAKSTGPAKTLFEAYRLLGRMHDGLEVLEQAVALRPDDAELMVYNANELASVGRYDEAVAYLDKAKGRAHANTWHRCAAHLASDNGDNEKALEHWLEIVKLAPLDVAAQQNIAALKKRIVGPDAEIDYLQSCVDRFPFHLGLLHTLYKQTRKRDVKESDQVLLHIIDKHPNDAWAQRELGFNQLGQPDGLDAAIQASDKAYAINPRSTETLVLRGKIARHQGKIDDARAEFRSAVEREIDYGYATRELIDIAPDREARRAEIAFVFEQLQTQTVFGEGIATYAKTARRALDDKQIERDLRALLKQREGLWPAWGALVDHLLRVGDHDAARETAKQSVERFPLTPGLWNRLAEIEHVRGDRAAQISCLERAIAISPDNQYATRELAGVYEFDGRASEAVQLLENTCARDPNDGSAGGQLADLYWAVGERDKAFARAKKTLEIDPYHDQVWNKLRYYASELKRKDEVNDLVRRVAEQRPGEANAWMTVAYHLIGREFLHERLDAVDHCITLSPRFIDAHDCKVRLLCQAHRHEEALAACDPPTLNGDVPYNLRGRAAWVEAERGRLKEAIQQMWKLVHEHPHYTWGLEQICNWCGDTDETEGLTKAANKLCDIEPDNPHFLNYRAYAAITTLEKGNPSPKAKQELKAQAKADFNRVAQLDPANTYCIAKLFGLYLEDKQYDPAVKLIAGAQGYLRDDDWLCKTVIVHAKRGDKDACREALRELCKVQTDNLNLLDEAFEHGREVGVAKEVLEQVINDPATNPAIAAQYIAEDLNTRAWKKATRKIDGLQDRPAFWDRAATDLISRYADHEAFTKNLTRFLKANKQRIHASEHAWNEAGFALASQGKNQLTFEHFRDWQNRENLKPWVLTNLACAYLDTSKLQQAADVTNHALGLPPDHSFGGHLINLAHCEAVQGDPERAHQLLDQVVFDHESKDNQFEYELARAAATARTHEPDHLKRAWAHLKHARTLSKNYKKNIPMRLSYQRIVKTIGKQTGFLGKVHAWLHIFLH